TGVVAYFTYSMSVVTNSAGSVTGFTPLGSFLFSGMFMWVVIFAPLAMVFFLSFRINSLNASTARLLFFVYAGILGISLATIFIAYTQASIARVFFISAAAFGALSLYGYTTKRDLSAMGAFMVMGLIGLIVASLVNIFLKSSGLDFAISVIGV